MFNQFKFSPADVSAWSVDASKALAQARPGMNAATFAGRVIADRLIANPAAYLEFGPYWWAVKAALLKLGRDFGPSDDVVIRAEYGGNLPAYGAMVAGERFKDYYRATYLVGSSDFWLDSDAELPYTLVDADMNARRAGLAGPEASDLVEGEGEGAGAVLDSAAADLPDTPYRLSFELDGALWTADLFAGGPDQARDKLKGLEASGRIARAVDFAKGIGGEPALDNADMDKPLFIDLKARRVCELEAV